LVPYHILSPGFTVIEPITGGTWRLAEGHKPLTECWSVAVDLFPQPTLVCYEVPG
jgi:hypothetical protein